MPKVSRIPGRRFSSRRACHLVKRQRRTNGLVALDSELAAPSAERARQGGNRRNQFGGVDGLCQMDLRSRPQCLDAIAGPRVRGQGRGGYPSDHWIAMGPDPFDQLKSVHPRHLEIRHDHVRQIDFNHLQRYLRSRRGAHSGPRGLQQLRNQDDSVGIVIDGDNVNAFEIADWNVLRHGGRTWMHPFRLAGRHGVDDHERKCERERRPLTNAAAPGLERAAVQFGELLCDRQSQSEPAALARETCVRLSEPLEDVRQKLRRDANAGVRNRDLDVRIDTSETDLDFSSTPREP